jgi:hypothetical protein
MHIRRMLSGPYRSVLADSRAGGRGLGAHERLLS